jgi:hypothetical protein
MAKRRRLQDEDGGSSSKERIFVIDGSSSEESPRRSTSQTPLPMPTDGGPLQPAELDEDADDPDDADALNTVFRKLLPYMRNGVDALIRKTNERDDERERFNEALAGKTECERVVEMKAFHASWLPKFKRDSLIAMRNQIPKMMRAINEHTAFGMFLSAEVPS